MILCCSEGAAVGTPGKILLLGIPAQCCVTELLEIIFVMLAFGNLHAAVAIVQMLSVADLDHILSRGCWDMYRKMDDCIVGNS